MPALYRHFPSRAALVEALCREEAEQLCASVDTPLARMRPDLALRRWMPAVKSRERLAGEHEA